MERTHTHRQCLSPDVLRAESMLRTSRSRIAGKMPATPHLRQWRPWILRFLTVLLLSTAGIGFCQIQPSGKKAGLIQFDVISEVNMEWSGATNIVFFAKYWVCEDYYAVSVVWTEPRGHGRDMKTAIVFSDGTGFRMDNELYSYWVPTNTTYPKPFGKRGPFRWGGGFYGSEETRFAEAQALARRVYVSDLGPAASRKAGADGIVDVSVPKAPGGVTRKLARLRFHAGDDRIESMELFDDQQRSLAKMRYEYEGGPGAARLSTLLAELPVRPEKLRIDTDVKMSASDGTETTLRIPDVNYVSHKGGRTCTVTYKDVTLGDKVLRLPVQVKVQRSDNKQILRTARLMNFKRVDLDKSGVWKAAEAFGRLGDDYPAWIRLVDKFLDHTPRLGPPSVDPNDFARVRRLVAKYPLPEKPPMPESPQTKREPLDLDPAVAKEQALKSGEAQRRDQALRQQQMKAWRDQVARMPKPARKTIEPNDARLIRQLRAHYRKMLLPPITEEQRTELRTKGGPPPSWSIPERLREVKELRDKFDKILDYHHAAPLPEDRAPEPNDSDVKLICQLKEHYEKLTQQEDRGLGGRLKALDALACLDSMIKDYDAFEKHVARYLQMLRDADLDQMYMVGGYFYIDNLIEAGRYRDAGRLFKQWADRSAAVNDADEVYRFCGSDLGGNGDPWAAVQLLDRFLKRPGLSPVQRYEGLALRAIALDKLDKLLADPETASDESRKALAGWVLSGTTKAQMAKLVEPAIRQAVSAWEALGSARLSEAKPYSERNMLGNAMYMTEIPDSTRLQETSARLDQIVRQRFGQKEPAPGPSGTKRPAPTRR